MSKVELRYKNCMIFTLKPLHKMVTNGHKILIYVSNLFPCMKVKIRSALKILYKRAYMCEILLCVYLCLSCLFQSRLPAVKVKYLLVAWFGILVASWVIYMQYSSYSELCRGHVCTMLIVSHSILHNV